MEGYFTGILDLYYATMTTEDTSSAAPIYDTPKVLAKSIEVTITPTYRERNAVQAGVYQHGRPCRRRRL